MRPSVRATGALRLAELAGVRARAPRWTGQLPEQRATAAVLVCGCRVEGHGVALCGRHFVELFGEIGSETATTDHRDPVPVARALLGLVLTCGGCRHSFEPDPVAFAAARLCCPSCGGWAFTAELVEPDSMRGWTA